MSPRTCIRQVATCVFFCLTAACLTVAPWGRTAVAADPPAAPAPVVQLAPNVAAQLAHSALLTIEGTATDNALQLRIRRVNDQSVVGSDDVTVTVDGKNEPVTREKGDVYELAVDELRGDVGRDVEVIVGHDGIREILAAKVAATQPSAAAGLLRDHKQVGWWILNIVIVLIAAIAISRRKG